MLLFKVWFHLDSQNIDVSLILPANSLGEAIQRAKDYAQTLNAKVKTVDNIHTGFSSSNKNKM
jgi:pyridoxal biosynthesis lyase PdxS